MGTKIGVVEDQGFTHIYRSKSLETSHRCSQEASFQILVLADQCMYCKKGLDEPKLWVGDST